MNQFDNKPEVTPTQGIADLIIYANTTPLNTQNPWVKWKTSNTDIS